MTYMPKEDESWPIQGNSRAEATSAPLYVGDARATMTLVVIVARARLPFTVMIQACTREKLSRKSLYDHKSSKCDAVEYYAA